MLPTVVRNNFDDLANKLSVVNKIIRKGYDYTYNHVIDTYKVYCESIKNSNYFELREQLMSELTPLVHSVYHTIDS